MTTVGDLIEALAKMDRDTEVRVAFSPGWPMELTIIPVVIRAKTDGAMVVYLVEASQGLLPEDVREVLGW